MANDNLRWHCDNCQTWHLPDQMLCYNNSDIDEARRQYMAARIFETGASRDTDEGKLDYEGFLSPIVLERYAEYMHEKRKMPDGSVRDGDNWQKGMPEEVYMKSLLRHVMTVWCAYRSQKNRDPNKDVYFPEEELCAILFNVQGLLFEHLKKWREG